MLELKLHPYTTCWGSTHTSPMRKSHKNRPIPATVPYFKNVVDEIETSSTRSLPLTH